MSLQDSATSLTLLMILLEVKDSRGLGGRGLGGRDEDAIEEELLRN